MVDSIDEAIAGPRGLWLTPAQRMAATGGRMLLQNPRPGEILLARAGSQGIAPDKLFVLQALEDLADQGNLIARKMLIRQRERLGITGVRYFFPK